MAAIASLTSIDLEPTAVPDPCQNGLDESIIHEY
jgi:hypothetical protein